MNEDGISNGVAIDRATEVQKSTEDAERATNTENWSQMQTESTPNHKLEDSKKGDNKSIQIDQYGVGGIEHRVPEGWKLCST